MKLSNIKIFKNIEFTDEYNATNFNLQSLYCSVVYMAFVYCVINFDNILNYLNENTKSEYTLLTYTFIIVVLVDLFLTAMFAYTKPARKYIKADNNTATKYLYASVLMFIKMTIITTVLFSPLILFGQTHLYVTYTFIAVPVLFAIMGFFALVVEYIATFFKFVWNIICVTGLSIKNFITSLLTMQ